MRAIKTITISTVAIGLLAGSAVGAVAQEEESSFKVCGVPGRWDCDQEAFLGYLWMRNALLATDVAEGDLIDGFDYYTAKAANLSEADIDELLAGSMLADREGDDDEFGQAEEDEPELGDDDMGDEDEDDD